MTVDEDTADGEYGPKTKGAVEAFQRNNGIHGNSKAYGVATTATQAVLLSNKAIPSYKAPRISNWIASENSFAVQKGHNIEYKNGNAYFHFEVYNYSEQPIVALVIRYCIVDSNNNIVTEKNRNWTTWQSWWYGFNLGPKNTKSFETEISTLSKAYRLFWTITEVVFANGEVYMDYDASNKKDYEYSGYSTYY